MIEQKDITEALDRIARTPDGQMLYRLCQKEVCSFLTTDHDGALRQHEGRRRFAAELMAYMAEGIQDSDRHAITFARASADTGAQPRSRGAARRVTADTFVPGYSPEPDAGPAPAGGAA